MHVPALHVQLLVLAHAYVCTCLVLAALPSVAVATAADFQPPCPGSAQDATLAMQQLLGTVPAAEFFASTWETVPAVLRGSALNFTGLLPYDQLAGIIDAHSAQKVRLNQGVPMLLGKHVVLFPAHL